jgi:hypothetical protein
VYEAHDGTSTRRVHDSKTRNERQFSWVRQAKGKAFRLPTWVCTRVQAGGLTTMATQAVRRTRRREGQKGQARCARRSSAAAPAGVRLDSMVGTQATASARRREAATRGKGRAKPRLGHRANIQHEGQHRENKLGTRHHLRACCRGSSISSNALGVTGMAAGSAGTTTWLEQNIEHVMRVHLISERKAAAWRRMEHHTL